MIITCCAGSAREVCDNLKKSTDVAETEIKGGLRRELKVRLDSGKLAAYGLSPLQVIGALRKGNVSVRSGDFPAVTANTWWTPGTSWTVPMRCAGWWSMSMAAGRSIFRMWRISGTARKMLNQYVFFGLGPAAEKKDIKGNHRENYPAVTVSVAKRKGANATWVAEDLLHRVELLKGKVIPSDIQVTVTRNYGETAKEKNNELLFHMFLAAISVTILIALFMGWRAGIVAAIAIPVTLALTLFVFSMTGYTLNRITLFALIFSIGILVDDAIVVIENIHRYFTTTSLKPFDAAVQAVDEIGNPTMLATVTVIASVLPMAFVSGLMGPYMRPIPVGSSMAMLFSLLVAFIVTPYFSYRLLRGTHAGAAEEARLMRFYRKVMGPLIHNRKLRYGFLATVVVLLLGSCSLLYFRLVTVKMLPFDNKSELQVIVDAPNGTALEETARLVSELGDGLRKVPEVTDFQSYIGISAPFNFNGLVRHYYLRKGSNLADIQVNFTSKSERSAQSHDIALRIRPMLKTIADRYGARIKVAEIPPARRCFPRWWLKSTDPTGQRGSNWPGRSRRFSAKPTAWSMWTGTGKTTRHVTVLSWTRKKPPFRAFQPKMWR